VQPPQPILVVDLFPELLDTLLSVASLATHKVKKQGQKVILELVENADFLLELPDTFIKVGFAAETEDLLKNARHKLVRKRLALICANDVTAPDAGFGVDTNRITILHATGQQEALPLMTKHAVAHEILNRVVPLLTTRTGHVRPRQV
jgi:phosphopantothenoylcysteine decarboxylase/phosphopantothenate--cysteine ligase